jgi:alanine-synthesizing transaminase
VNGITFAGSSAATTASAFADQHVVGAAGGGRVHRFDADAARDQGRSKAGTGNQARSAAEDHQLRPRHKPLEVAASSASPGSIAQGALRRARAPAGMLVGAAPTHTVCGWWRVTTFVPGSRRAEISRCFSTGGSRRIAECDGRIIVLHCATPPAAAQPAGGIALKPIAKSSKLANVCYDIRGPVLDKARQMEDEGHKIIKLNIGNLAVFGLEPPDEIVQDMIRNLPHTAGYTDSKGLFAPRKAVVHYTQEKHIAGVTVDDVYLGNGASELITMSLNALLNSGDEVLVPAPDYPLWTASVSLSGGTPVHYLCDEGADWMPDIEDIRARSRRAHQGYRGHQPEQPDRRAVPRRAAARDRRDRPPAPADRLRRRDLRQDAVRRRHAHQHRVAGRRRAVRHLQRPVEELPLLRLPRRLDGGLGRQAPCPDYIEGLNMLSSMRLCSNTPGQLAIQTALGGYQSIKDLVAPGGRLCRQRDLAYDLLTQIPGVSVVKPKAALYMFPRLDPKIYPIADDQQFAYELLAEEKVLIVQGTGFNWPHARPLPPGVPAQPTTSPRPSGASTVPVPLPQTSQYAMKEHVRCQAIQVGLLGIGTVGSGHVQGAARNQEEIRRRAGRGIEITMVADLDTARARAIVGGRVRWCRRARRSSPTRRSTSSSS